MVYGSINVLDYTKYTIVYIAVVAVGGIYLHIHMYMSLSQSTVVLCTGIATSIIAIDVQF